MLLTRGAASILGDRATWRGPGFGHAMVSIEPTLQGIGRCLIGTATWSSSPEIDSSTLCVHAQALSLRRARSSFANQANASESRPLRPRRSKKQGSDPYPYN